MSTTEASLGDVKLKKCTACYLVKYCGVECQRKHRPQHKSACKKRAAELKEELLFKQPESTHLGDCPICLLPIPIDKSQYSRKYIMHSCCSKVVCNCCVYANLLRQLEARLPPKCPFCRHPRPKTDAEADLLTAKRAEANDPVALDDVGTERFNAEDYASAIEYWEKAAGLGHAESHYRLSLVYEHGFGVEKDTKKVTHHLEQAAIGGHHLARHNLGVLGLENHNSERAVKHFIIAANLGCDLSIKELKEGYARGIVRKEDFAAALRAHQAAVDATKSPQRDAAEALSQLG